MKSFNKIIILLLLIGSLAGSCKKDFLSRPPLAQITTDNFYKSTSDLRLATAALYGGSPGSTGSIFLYSVWAMY